MTSRRSTPLNFSGQLSEPRGTGDGEFQTLKFAQNLGREVSGRDGVLEGPSQCEPTPKRTIPFPGVGGKLLGDLPPSTEPVLPAPNDFPRSTNLDSSEAGKSVGSTKLLQMEDNQVDSASQVTSHKIPVGTNDDAREEIVQFPERPDPPKRSGWDGIMSLELPGNPSNEEVRRELQKLEREWEKKDIMKQSSAATKVNQARLHVRLKDAPPELKRVIGPYMHLKVLESMLLHWEKEALEVRMPLVQYVQSPEHVARLRDVCSRLERGGEAEHQLMLEEINEMTRRALKMQSDEMIRLEKEALEQEERERKAGRKRTVVSDIEEFSLALETAQERKREGLEMWQKGDKEGALEKWQKGVDMLTHYAPPLYSVELKRNLGKESDFLVGLQSALLRNVAQAAISLGDWEEAMDAANRALNFSEDDHKAWFRKSCALEGLERFEESLDCLAKIDHLSVGRPDQERLQTDVQKRRNKILEVKAKQRAREQKMVQASLKQGVFDREGELSALQGPKQSLTVQPRKPVQPKVARGLRPGEWKGRKPDAAAKLEEATSAADARERAEFAKDPLADRGVIKRLGEERMRLTYGGARDLLHELRDAYSDSFVERVDKLARDVLFDPGVFISHLHGLAMEVHGPVLEKWGFKASNRGLQEMKAAVRDHTTGPGAQRLVALNEYLNKRLCGSEMHERVTQFNQMQR